MICGLSIRNYAIIEHLEINFSDHLTIITGETGAGKSIMLGALGLIMGKRADTKVLYDTNNKCIVEAVFNVSPYALEQFFEENDLDYEAETVIRREITTSGKSRAFVNDTPVRLGILKELSNKLIDLHQQFDTLDIHDADFQMKVVDALADNKKLLAKYTKAYRAFDKDRKELDKLIHLSSESNKETDFLEFQLSELLEAKLQPNEQEELEQEQKQLTNAEDIKRILGGAADHLTESENAISGQINELLREINSIVEFHPKLPKLVERFEGMLYELEEVANEYQGIADDTEYDGERLQIAEERLDMIYRLQTKHNVDTIEELLEIQEDLQERLQNVGDLSSKIEALEAAIDLQEVELLKQGEVLSERRVKAIPKFEKKVHKLLEQLSMAHALLKVELTNTGEINATGVDRLRFLFAANKGSRFEEIKGVASGGELSRLALCIKSLVASAIPLPTIIFDEIDSGVSGEVALQMGDILQKLASEHQIVSITHSPQIAAKADIHYFVHKEVTKDRTLTAVRELQEEERVLEIAKMLSGNPPTEYAKANARELLTR